ncbi:hypothetical protein PsorP6_003962 [Peronosclerospora sorghi]|uniref:Uncharacterized protein n=1 Tax=Peronosclerospora sorghi TaxID=230839 RepID=A0ACC0VQU1_9STRA|nr:hypothetical protein PsorP6_003962 [Peronosclerospora sorghi]
MPDRAANIAMDTRASAQVLTPTSSHLVRSVEEVMDQDVNHWLETSLVAESKEHPGPATTARESAAATRQLQRRQAVVRGITGT